MKDKIETVLSMRDLTLKVQNEIIEKIGDKMPDSKKCELSVVEDDFVLMPDNSNYSNFYVKINRSNYEVIEFRSYNRYSLAVINEVCNEIVSVLKKYETDFNKLFGIKLETVEDFEKHCKFLLDAAIEKRYVIGMIKKRGYGDSYDEYGIVFEPSGFFDISFTDEDKRYYDKSRMRCYIEFDKETIDTQDLADFLIKIVEKNKATIEKYIEEGKNGKD